jgi:hypothetical protein
MDMLNLDVAPNFDESIEGIEYHSHHPYASTKLQSGDEIRIAVQHQDIYTFPHHSFLYLEGKFLTQNQAPKSLKLTKNAFAFLFDEIRYELCGVEIDRVRNPGISTTLKGLASFKQGSSWCHSEISTGGHFNVCIPLAKMLGFAEDYQKIIINVKQELILVRSRQDDNCYIFIRKNASDTVEVGKIVLDKLVWKLPYVTVSEYERLSLMRHLKSEKIISMSFRGWELYEYPLLPATHKQVWSVKTTSQLNKPRFILLAFQTGRAKEVEKDASEFDHCSITNVKLYLNSKSYPYDDMNLNFERGHYALLYHMYASFQSCYYPGSTSQPILTREEFKEKAPIIIIDCSRQPEAIKSGPVDVRLEFEASTSFPADTTAYCLIISDRLVEYNPLTNIVHRPV